LVWHQDFLKCRGGGSGRGQSSSAKAEHSAAVLLGLKKERERFPGSRGKPRQGSRWGGNRVFPSPSQGKKRRPGTRVIFKMKKAAWGSGSGAHLAWGEGEKWVFLPSAEAERKKKENHRQRDAMQEGKAQL